MRKSSVWSAVLGLLAVTVASIWSDGGTDAFAVSQ